MRVVSNTAISLDGRINTREGRFTSLGTARDHERMSRLRGQADAVLVGGSTFRNWPRPSLPEEEHRVPGAPPLWNVIVSRTGDLPLSAELLGETGVRVLLLVLGGCRLAASAPPGIEVAAYPGPGQSLPVSWMLGVLAERGVQRLLVEAGGDLLAQFLAAGALHEMNVTLCPLLIGGETPSLIDGPGFPFSEMPRLKLLAAEVEGDEIFLRYAVSPHGA
jgi:riboflavin biosynthesis pyrimidine reductase